VDRVKPLKIESTDTGGDETDDFPTSLDKNEDFVDCRGVVFQNDTSDTETVAISRDASDNMTFFDGVVSGTKTLADLLSGGMSEATHRALDVLVHELDEDYYEEYTYTSGKITNITVWETSGKTKKIREYAFTYTGVQVTEEVQTQYDSAGTWSERLTLTYAYTSSMVANITTVRTTNP